MIRRAFIGQAPLCALAFVAVFFILRLPKQEHSHWRTKLGQVDFFGATTLVIAILALLFGLDNGSNNSWSSPLTLATILGSLPIFVIFVLIEMKVATHPFAPGHIILSPSLLACYLCNFFAFASYISNLFYSTLFPGRAGFVGYPSRCTPYSSHLRQRHGFPRRGHTHAEDWPILLPHHLCLHFHVPGKYLPLPLHRSGSQLHHCCLHLHDHVRLRRRNRCYHNPDCLDRKRRSQGPGNRNGLFIPLPLSRFRHWHLYLCYRRPAVAAYAVG
jgi:hypothetical protein